MKYSVKLNGSGSLYWRLLEDELDQLAGRKFKCESQEADVVSWLRSEIGKQCETWIVSLSDELLYFKHEEDKVKFILRWL